MPFLIDGHNLIPKLGLRLDDPDDELELVRLLQDFARIRRQPVEVYFDGAPPGQAGMRKLGSIKAHFVRLGTTADNAIRRRLENMGRSARNWTVVSSDHEVQSAAKVHQAKSITSDEFAGLMQTARMSDNSPKSEERKISPKEVDEWLRLFGGED